jgi:hypothetical protein
MKRRMRFKRICVVLFAAVLAGMLLTRDEASRAFSTGPDAGRTGAPGELTCATGECHGTGRNTGPGQFMILAPDAYEPGETYPIEVRHRTGDPTRKRWGYQITALSGANARAGVWRASDDRTQLIEDTLPGFRRQYAQHTEKGTFRDQGGGASWIVPWTAPATDVGPVTFYAAGNQADGNDNSNGDQIYTTQATIRARPPRARLPYGASLLFFNLYTSGATNQHGRHARNTRIHLANTDEQRGVRLRLFLVNGADGSAVDEFVSLRPQQQIDFLASDLDPGVTGYLIAVAVDAATGCPIPFNALVGSAYVKLDSGHAADLVAEGFAMSLDGPSPCAPGSRDATLRFDGLQYDTAPRVLALSNLPSRAEGNQTLLVLNRFDGALPGAAPRLGGFSGFLFDDRKQSLAFTGASSARQFLSPLSNEFPRGLDGLIPAGRQGWMKFWLNDDAGILGAAIQFNPTTNPTSFSQGRNLHKLSFTRATTMTIRLAVP